MMRSLFAAVSGLRNHQVRMDVIGNNIANVNTAGFKSGRVTFQELFSQTIRGAAAPRDDRGGTNPQQVGLGSALASIDNIHTQGSLQVTGQETDLGLQGAGFFILSYGETRAYTRVGTFDVDAEGYLVDPASGLRVNGWRAVEGEFGARDAQNLTEIRIPLGQEIPAQATSRLALAGNLDAGVDTGYVETTAVEVFDSLGRRHVVEIAFEKTADNQWSWAAEGPDGPAGSGTINFTTSGVYEDVTSEDISFTLADAEDVDITVSFEAMSQMAGDFSATVIERNGFAKGALENFTIDSTGVITGLYTNGITRALGQVGVAAFPNPGGLIKTGENLFMESNNSGLVSIGEAGSGNRGQIMPGTLEMSNVDLAREFTDMIITQRGFQANSRLISVTDEMLNELVNLKR